MKKKLCLLLILCILLPTMSLADEQEALYGSEIQIITATKKEEAENYLCDISYPIFSCNDSELQAYLTKTITEPILEMADPFLSLLEGSDKTEVTITYQASTEEAPLMSIYANGSIKPGNGAEKQTLLFSKVILLTEKRELSLGELFDTNEETIVAAINHLVYEKVKSNENLLEGLDSEEALPKPEYYALMDEKLVILYPRDRVFHQSIIISISLDELAPLCVKNFSVPREEENGTESMDAIAELKPETEKNIFPEETSFPSETIPIQLTPAPAATLDPLFSLAPVITPTPLPLSLSDYEILNVLSHGLWKPLGTDGTQYYQFTEDGKLLTVTVENFTLEEGLLQSESINGTIDVGSDSAFTLEELNGKRSGFVLNRQGDRVAPEEFVTPSPTPVPTPTPSPTPIPSATPSITPEPQPSNSPTPVPTATPEPTPVPTPTLSPYEIALLTVPVLKEDIEAEFKNIRSLKVFHGPSEKALQFKEAIVTTDETVIIFGQEKDWLLVGYEIGNGSRGRIAYIQDSTLNKDKPIQNLDFAFFPIILTQNAKATDDPLHGKETLFSLEKGDSVTLLAFFQNEWAYIETTYNEKTCRVFIPVKAIQE